MPHGTLKQGMSPNWHDIRALERQLDDAEGNDEQVHKLHNNMGVALTGARDYNLALRHHTLEKQACRRLSDADPDNGGRLVDLAIAYRLCGDAMMRVKGLLLKERTIKDRREILKTAHAQHERGLVIVLDADQEIAAARVEVQAACAAVAHSALMLGMETREKEDLERACSYNAKAASIANELGHADRVSLRKKRVRLLGAAINIGIALSALKEGKRARTMLEAAAVRAKQWGDEANFARAVANLAEEANINSDWEMCEKYIRLWIDYAKSIQDEGEESDALRKLGSALYKQHRKKEAADAFQRALLLATEEEARKEARTNLRIAEAEVEDERKLSDDLRQIEESIPALVTSRKFAEEAKARIAANEIAYRLRKPDDVIEHCTRYVELVDNFNCEPETTGIGRQTHSFAIANLADAYWQRGECAQAVHWATRELMGFGDDVAGQAQAWCNLGVYLTDDGKKEEGIDALKKSIELAKEAGDAEIARRAQANIDITVAESERSASLAVGEATQEQDGGQARELLGEAAGKLPLLAKALNAGSLGSGSVAVEKVQMSPLRAAPPTGTVSHLNETTASAAADATTDGRSLARNATTNENSVVVFSGDVDGETGMHPPRQRQPDENSSGAYSVSRPRAGDDGSRSTTASRDTHSTGGGGGRIVPVAEEYKRLCESGRLQTVHPRSSIVTALRTASASLLSTTGRRDECIDVDVRACFLSDFEVEFIFKALSVFGKETPVSLNLAQNPLLSNAAYRIFAEPVKPSDGCALIRRLDLSSAGLDASSLQMIAQATQAGRGLSSLADVTLSKNALGRNAAACAFSCAMLLTSTPSLESVDLSNNLLSAAFLTRLVALIRRKMGADADGEGRQLKHLDIKINNRTPALLDFEDEKEAVGCVSGILEVFPGLNTLDLRVCGANDNIRKALYSFAMESGAGGKVVLVSPGTFDEAAS